MLCVCLSAEQRLVPGPGQVLTHEDVSAVLHACRQGGQARSVRVRELEGQLEAVRSHYHGKVRALEVKLQVSGASRVVRGLGCGAHLTLNLLASVDRQLGSHMCPDIHVLAA